MAKAFQFRLEAVRRLREQARDRQRRAVANAAAELSKASALQATLDENLQENIEQIRGQKAAGILEVQGLRATYLYQGWLLRKTEDVTATMKQCIGKLAAERKTLTEADARLKAIEKLRERRWNRHAVELRREEQTAADEFSRNAFLKWEANGSHPAAGESR